MKVPASVNVYEKVSPSWPFGDRMPKTSILGNGQNAWFGWPTSPRIEQLRTDWFNAPDAAEPNVSLSQAYWLNQNPNYGLFTGLSLQTASEPVRW